MIKKIKGMDPNLKFYTSKIESEINRGISKLCILAIINQNGDKGIHGYQILKELQKETGDAFVIEEGTLYPILRKLEEEGMIRSQREEIGRKKKFYYMTTYGKKVFNYLEGFLSKLIEAIAPLFDIKVKLKIEKYIFCPMCANKIEVKDVIPKFCDVCGYNIENEIRKRGLKIE
ncbi:MAG: PadR family transcriptional regulator [Promethearchaeota archaeon]